MSVESTDDLLNKIKSGFEKRKKSKNEFLLELETFLKSNTKKKENKVGMAEINVLFGWMINSDELKPENGVLYEIINHSCNSLKCSTCDAKNVLTAAKIEFQDFEKNGKLKENGMLMEILKKILNS